MKMLVSMMFGSVKMIGKFEVISQLLIRLLVLNSSISVRLVMIGEIENGRLISVIRNVLLWKLNLVMIYVVVMLKMVFIGIEMVVMISVSWMVECVL